jgi:hypothetical protein
VESVSLSFLLPLSGRLTRLPLKSDSRPDEELFEADLNIVTRDYFRTLNIPVTRGRAFQFNDGAQAEAEAVVSRSLAERLWPGSDPIGQRIRGMAPLIDGRSRTVIGVVGDVRHADFYTEPSPMVYLPYSQVEGRAANNLLRLLTFVTIRTQDAPRMIVVPTREAVRSLDSAQPVWELKPFEQVVLNTLAPERLQTYLFTLLGGLALILAATGVFALVLYAVTQRMREMAVRLAVGARRYDIVTNLLKGGLRPVAWGLAIGTFGSWIMWRIVDLNVRDTDPLDPLIYMATVIVWLTVAVLASVLPASKVLRINAGDLLRHE